MHVPTDFKPPSSLDHEIPEYELKDLHLGSILLVGAVIERSPSPRSKSNDWSAGYNKHAIRQGLSPLHPLLINMSTIPLAWNIIVSHITRLANRGTLMENVAGLAG